MTVVGQELFEVAHALRSGRLDHGLTVGALDPEPRSAGNHLAQFSELFVGVVLTEVHGKHATASAAAERGMLKVVIEDQQVARL